MFYLLAVLQEYFWVGNILIGFLDWIWLIFVDWLWMTDDGLLRTDDWGQGNENRELRIENYELETKKYELMT